MFLPPHNPNNTLLIAFIRNSFPLLGKHVKTKYDKYDLKKYDISLLTDILFEICRELSVEQLKEVKDNANVSSLYNWYRERVNANPKFFPEESERLSNTRSIEDEEVKLSPWECL